jgi:small conductance mechanosensitive channel
MLDSLHGGGVEIVSPAFMTQRVLDPGLAVLPDGRGSAPAPASDEDSASVVFDKADAASRVADLRKELDAITEEIEALEERRKNADDKEHEALDREIDHHQRRRDWIEQAVATAEKNLANEKD